MPISPNLSEKLRLNSGQRADIEVMKSILYGLRGAPVALKGGTALMLFYGLDRFSEDLDFDTFKSFDMKPVLQKYKNPYINEITVKKHTPTVQRYRVSWIVGDQEGNVTLEISFRQSPKKNDVQETTLGVPVLTPFALLKQKFDALKSRTTARDLFDIAYLAVAHPDEFSIQDKQKLCQIYDNFNDTYARFEFAFREDTKINDRFLETLVRIEQAVKMFRDKEKSPAELFLEESVKKYDQRKDPNLEQ